MPMLAALRDPIFTAILAILAIMVSIWVYFAQRPRKRLLVERIARVPLVTMGSAGIGGLKITFADRELQSALVVLVNVQCIGNLPILATDYELPLSFSFESDAVVLSADRVESQPGEIPIHLDCAGSRAIVSGRLLNPGDSFTVRILVENSKGRMTSNARIAGITSIETSKRVSFLPPTLVVMGVALVIFALWLVPEDPSKRVSQIRPEEITSAVLSVVGTLIASLGAGMHVFTVLRRLRQQVRHYVS